MNSFRKLVTFAKKFARDTRGDDASSTTYALTTAGKTVITGVVIAAMAGGATVAVNNANKQTDKTAQTVNSVGGAQSTSTQAANTPFKMP